MDSHSQSAAIFNPEALKGFQALTDVYLSPEAVRFYGRLRVGVSLFLAAIGFGCTLPVMLVSDPDLTVVLSGFAVIGFIVMIASLFSLNFGLKLLKRLK